MGTQTHQALIPEASNEAEEKIYTALRGTPDTDKAVHAAVTLILAYASYRSYEPEMGLVETAMEHALEAFAINKADVIDEEA
ncbi:hypothetical protein [Pseudovibrio sp. Ad26]|uniref:hypothetical protein n=1 Tax=Pseudovibrio sp. Ad26 TaxID=989410 RepID=UPI0007AEA86C|nr:hypothetical protein [Pseudovibrio sp. Ad26]KZL11712.1 hypothetical protein PsAD26_02569 [Pseudovibrio sp. Ad26]